ncbi:DMT family transporter [Ancylobacter sp. VNQ12]|uniref:DMT family transporter n=1 Tax=Ancylobacter sp. VNQ12 TaxID=3400920 RepID=UPI003BFAC833
MSGAPRDPTDYLHLLVIYVVWASGYLAMKLGMEGPSAFTAYQLQGGRLLLGGSILLLLAWRRGVLRPLTPREWLICGVSAFLFWICANGFALLALRELPSGFVAMAMGTIPLWSAAFEAVRSRKVPAQPLALAIGFIGLALIYLPTMTNGSKLNPSAMTVAMLFAAPIAWTVATSLQPSLQRELDGRAVAGTQLVLGGIMASAIALAHGMPLPSPPSAQTLVALFYLAIFASAVSFQSYVKATALFSPNVVAAFAYVNPPIGVLLGWLVLGEKPVPVSMLGMIIVMASVMMTVRATLRTRTVKLDTIPRGAS